MQSIGSEEHRKELETAKNAKNAFSDIQDIAARIIQIHLEHTGVLPEKSIAWANKTLGMQFIDVEIYFDPYSPMGENPKEAVVTYYKETGEIFGLIMGEINKASMIIKSGT